MELLEIAKLIIAGLTPLVVLGLTVAVSRATRRFEESQWANRQVIEKRVELYDEMAPELNDILCAFLLVGDFKCISPEEVIRKKRSLDRQFYVYKHLFSERFEAAYKSFEETYFRTFAAVGKPAQLKTDPAWQRAERGDDWAPEWAKLFAPAEYRSDANELVDAYEGLLRRFADELGVRPPTAGPQRRRGR